MAAGNMNAAQAGEELARSFLQANGYGIVDTNWRYRQLELDIVCFQQDTYVFVEVKTKTDIQFGYASEALTIQKQKKMLKAVSSYLSKNKLWAKPCRLDLVAVLISQSRCEIIHEQNVVEFSEVMGGGGSYWQPW